MVVAVDGTLRMVEEGEVEDLAVEEAADAALRAGGVAGVPETRVGRAVEALGEVTFRVPLFIELVVDRAEGTVVFRASEGDAVVDPVEEATDALLVTPGVDVAREDAVEVLVVLVAPLTVDGVLEARMELAVGFVAVEERAVGEVAVFVAVAVLLRGVLEGFAVVEVGTVGFLLPVPVSPAAAKDDIRLLTLGGLSVITIWYTISQ